MIYRVLMHLDIEVRSPEEAASHAKNLLKLIQEPLVVMAIESEGIRLVEKNGRPTVYNPQLLSNGSATATPTKR